MSAPDPSVAAPTATAAPGPTAAPAAAPRPISAPPPGYVIPSLGWRILGGALRLVPMIVLLIGLPVGVFSFLQSHGIQPPIPLLTIEYFGIALSILITLRYILKPTAAYGPLAIATAGVSLLYLYLLLLAATYALAVPGAHVTISLGYSRLILILMIGPALALTAGVLTLVEDVASPKERLPFDYPA
jgi:hypothetical protein